MRVETTAWAIYWIGWDPDVALEQSAFSTRRDLIEAYNARARCRSWHRDRKAGRVRAVKVTLSAEVPEVE